MRWFTVPVVGTYSGRISVRAEDEAAAATRAEAIVGSEAFLADEGFDLDALEWEVLTDDIEEGEDQEG